MHIVPPRLIVWLSLLAFVTTLALNSLRLMHVIRRFMRKRRECILPEWIESLVMSGWDPPASRGAGAVFCMSLTPCERCVSILLTTLYHLPPPTPPCIRQLGIHYSSCYQLPADIPPGL